MVSSVLPGLAGSTDQASSLSPQCEHCAAMPLARTRYLLPRRPSTPARRPPAPPHSFSLPFSPLPETLASRTGRHGPAAVTRTTPPLEASPSQTEAEQKLRLVAVVVLVHGIVPGSPEPPPIPRFPPLQPPRVELDCGHPRPSPTTPSAQLHSG